MPKRKSTDALSHPTKKSRYSYQTTDPKAYRLSKSILRPRQKVTLKYFDSRTITATTAGSFGTTYRLNSLFDPDATGVGHQPRGYDQIKELYQKYVVTKANVVVNFRNDNTTSRVIPGLIVNDEFAYTAGTESDLMEHSALKTNYKRLLRASGSDNAGAAAQTVIKQMVNMANWEGTKDLFGDDTAQADIAASPIDQCFLHICGAFNGAGSLDVDIWIEFEAYMMDPKNPTSS